MTRHVQRGSSAGRHGVLFAAVILTVCLSDRAWAQCKLLASDAAASDFFGFSVSISGDSVIVGAYQDDDNGSGSGSAYVYRFDGSSWSEQAKLLATDGAAEDRFGFSVSISGDSAIVGAYLDDDNGSGSGSAYVYRFDGSSWSEQAKLLASDGAEGDRFGLSVSISGDSAIVGAYLDDDNGITSGSAYVYRFDGSTWTQQAKLLASDGEPGDRFGEFVSVSGDTAVVGAPANTDNGINSGSAYVYSFDGSTWTQQAKLLASDGEPGDRFGVSVSVNGDVVVVGASRDDDNGFDSGSAYVYSFDGSTWNEVKLLASDGAGGDQFGVRVAISGDTAVVGARLDDDNGTNSGSAYVYRFDGSTWTEDKLLAPDGAAGDRFGEFVSISGDTAVVGAYLDDDNGTDSGSAYVFGLGCGGPLIEFDDPEEFPANAEPVFEAVGNIDADAGDLPDAVALIPGTSAGQVQVFFNQGIDLDGVWLGFDPGAPIDVGLEPSGVAVGLYDDDAFLDLAVSNAGDSTVSILINNGDGTFTAGTPINVGSRPSAVIAADFNLDTLTDLAVSDFIDDTVRIYHGDGLGGFVLADTINTGGMQTGRVRPKDVDNDKDIDVVGVTRQFSAGPGPTGSVFVLLNLEAQTGGFDPTPVNYPVGTDPLDLSVADLDGDFYTDIVAVNSGDDTVSVLINDGDGTYTDWQGGVLAVGATPLSIDAVDLDGDLDPDLAIVADDAGIGPAVQVVQNLSEVGFLLFNEEILAFSVEAMPNYVVDADLNLDLAFDLITVNADEGPSGGSVTALLNAQAQWVLPATFSFDGLLLGGNIANLYTSDDLYLTLGAPTGNGLRDVARLQVAPKMPMVRLELEGTTAMEAPALLEVTVEAATNPVPLPPLQKITMLNYVANEWVVIDQRRAGSADAVAEILIDTNAGQYVKSEDGTIRMRIDWFDPTNVMALFMWNARTDQVGWTVTP